MCAASHDEIISDLPFIRAFPAALRHRVVTVIQDVSEPQDVKQGTILLRKGDTTSDDGYILLEGTVEVLREDIPTTTVHPPALLGEVKQFNPAHERIADVTALQDLKVLHFNWEDFNAAVVKSLSESELALFLNALSEYAWQHIVG